jgi:hypothetical protein
MIASLGSVWLQKLFCVCDCKNCWLFLWLQKKKEPNQCVIATILRACLQPGVMCGCKIWLCLCGWKATWLFGIWLQAWVVCDCKTAGSFVIAKPILCVTLQTHMVIFMIAKKRTEPVCDCNYFACVIATRSYLWLQTLTVSVWLKLLGYLVYDCKPV